MDRTHQRVERADSELRHYCERILRVRSTGWTQGIFANFAAKSMVPKGPEWGGGNWIWNIESSYILDLWWTKVPEIIPRALSWRRKAEFNKWEYFGELFHKAPIEIAPTKDELQSKWYTPRNDYVITLFTMDSNGYLHVLFPKLFPSNNLSKEAKAFIASVYSDEIPANTEQALNSIKWKKAMEEEMEALIKNITWE
nr:transducin/WD40 repeat-like superfamily protein [Tanacetum cinerariifolium]